MGGNIRAYAPRSSRQYSCFTNIYCTCVGVSVFHWSLVSGQQFSGVSVAWRPPAPPIHSNRHLVVRIQYIENDSYVNYLKKSAQNRLYSNNGKLVITSNADWDKQASCYETADYRQHTLAVKQSYVKKSRKLYDLQSFKTKSKLCHILTTILCIRLAGFPHRTKHLQFVTAYFFSPKAKMRK